jgi:hypothetical protein
MTTLIDGIRAMLTHHWFWGAITLVCLAWYSTVTIYIAIKGFGDIRTMLRKLSESKGGSERESPATDKSSPDSRA